MNRTEDGIYTTLCALFAVLIVMGNLIYQKFVFLAILPFYTFELSVGAILYPLTFLLTDLISEFYGKNRANFCVKLALALNITVALIIAFMDKLNATGWSKVDNETFHKVFGLYGVSFLGSIIACYIAQSIDIKIYLWIRKLTGDKYLWLRSNCSTAISLGSIWIPGSYFTSNPISDLSRDFPLFFMLCTNSKNPKYSGNFS